MTKQITCEMCGQPAIVSKHARLPLCGKCKQARRNHTFREYYKDPKSSYYVPKKKVKLLKDDVDMTLEEVGSEMGISKERVRQLEARAAEKIYNQFQHMREWVTP